MRLTLGSHSFDLTTRALVMGVDGAPEALVAQGADIVELAHLDRPIAVPVCIVASGDHAVERALAAGAGLVCLRPPTTGALRRCATSGVAVMVPSGATDEAAAAGLPPDRIVSEDLLLDVTGEAAPSAATAVGVIRGARIVRTVDIGGARRVCDVLAAILESP